MADKRKPQKPLSPLAVKYITHAKPHGPFTPQYVIAAIDKYNRARENMTRLVESRRPADAGPTRASVGEVEELYMLRNAIRDLALTIRVHDREQTAWS